MVIALVKETDTGWVTGSLIRDVIQDGPGSNSLIHTPYCILTSADIKLGYFESSVVPSSNQAKENNGGTQLGSVA